MQSFLHCIQNWHTLTRKNRLISQRQMISKQQKAELRVTVALLEGCNDSRHTHKKKEAKMKRSGGQP